MVGTVRKDNFNVTEHLKSIPGVLMKKRVQGSLFPQYASLVYKTVTKLPTASWLRKEKVKLLTHLCTLPVSFNGTGILVSVYMSTEGH